VSSLFTKATKAEAKARIAVTGPSGSGKTYSSLLWAQVLAEGGKIAVIDTERDSAKLYADRFDFDSLSMSAPYHPDRLVEALKVAEAEGYACVVIDSLTHFWNGQGGILEIVDQAGAANKGNAFSGWKVATPIQQRMVDAILAFDGHIITTMRSKTEYSLEKNEYGKISPKKVGLAPQQRDGIEYEYTLVLEMDTEHRTIIGKTRCEMLADKVFPANAASDGANTFLNWLKSGDPTITATERDVLDGKIRTLTPEQRRALKDVWGDAGLPKVATLPASRYAEALAMVASIAADGVTDEDDVPSEEVAPS
jgi:energy-coupling factor transporter ATP-binding protein EcfA2